jgi:hypothetical protein
VITRLLQTGLLIGVVTLANGQGVSRPDVPDEIKAPANEQVVMQARASGAQIYVCQRGADGKMGWTVKAPEADLHDGQGALIGRHYAGPTWKHKDGSEVTGKAVARVDSPDSGSIPWLLGGRNWPFRKWCAKPCHEHPANSHKGRAATTISRLQRLEGKP